MTAHPRDAALAAHRAGRLDEAERLYRAALGADGRDADALHLLGLVRERRGDAAEGERLIRAALIEREEPVFHLNLGTLLLGAGRAAEAETAYRRALALQPGLADAAGRLGALLLGAGRDAEAEAALSAALAQGTGNADLHNMTGVARMRLRDADGARASLERALALAPGHVDARFNLGLLAQEDGRDAEAVAAFRAVVAARPDHAAAHFGLGTVLIRARRLVEARASLERALALAPAHADALFNLGLLQVEAGEENQAEASFRAALRAAPDHARAKLALGTVLLGRGAYAEGWPLNEGRYAPGARSPFIAPPAVPYPRWAGEDLSGRSVLVWAEQGFGDAIQFVRFATELKRRGAARVTVATFPPLARLFAGVEGVDRVTTEVGDPGPHDVWTYPLSVPLHLGTTVDAIPARLPYLAAPPAPKAAWAARLPRGPELRVGLVWRGSPAQDNDARRSLPGLATLAPLWSVPGVAFVSLQKGEGEAEAAAWARNGKLLDLGPGLGDFADTAAAIEALDLVVSVCTAVAHLAGALGKPCFVLLPAKGADWRWLQDRDDSPWYPGAVRLFRTARGEDWGDVVPRVASAVEALAQARRDARPAPAAR